ncbi:aldehyde dehydrogenase family protein [Mycobacterium xenopi 3993]|nr:aldehyde dehydrogenase family protein [Mycobacterium xenopi 3993]
MLAVMPWNFPLWQAVRFAAPALMAGNVGILKHASNVPQTALYLADVIARGGFPDGCFQTLLVPSSAVETILRDPRVAAATLTGSEPAGRSVAAIAGDEIKPTVLELGGSDPFIVMPSADLDAAVSTAVTARVQNNGQSCIAAKRFIIHTDVYDAFVEKFVEQMAALRVGDPTDPDTDVGPLATEQGRADVEKLVDEAVAAGAVIRCGGKRLDRPGWFYPPTVITDIRRDMPIFCEEVFGPVASVYRAADIDEAIEIANATTFGLGSNAWTRDESEQQRFIDGIEAGQVFINGMVVSYPSCRSAASSDPAMAASSPATGSASSATPKRSGSAHPRPATPVAAQRSSNAGEQTQNRTFGTKIVRFCVCSASMPRRLVPWRPRRRTCLPTAAASSRGRSRRPDAASAADRAKAAHPLVAGILQKLVLGQAERNVGAYSAKPSAVSCSASGISSFMRLSNTVQLASSAATWRRHVKVPHAI